MAEKKKGPIDLIFDKRPQGELTDPFTGLLFEATARNHYEINDGVPFAPAVDIPRPSVRERVENLLRRGIDPLARYVGTEGYEMDVPDDPEEPLTPSEMNYIDTVAEQIAENANLPDEGLPAARTEPLSEPIVGQPLPSGAHRSGPQAAPEGRQDPPREMSPSSPQSTVPTR